MQRSSYQAMFRMAKLSDLQHQIWDKHKRICKAAIETYGGYK